MLCGPMSIELRLNNAVPTPSDNNTPPVLNCSKNLTEYQSAILIDSLVPDFDFFHERTQIRAMLNLKRLISQFCQKLRPKGAELISLKLIGSQLSSLL